VPGVLVFLWATLLTTLLHLGKFHFSSPDRFAKGAAWLWLIIYAADPVLVSVALAFQLRARGTDPPRAAPLPDWYRSLLVLQSLVTLTVGVMLFAAPAWAAGWWPWALTPLTARAMASWLLGLGVVLATAFFENDWARIRAATAAYAVLGILQLVALTATTSRGRAPARGRTWRSSSACCSPVRTARGGSSAPSAADLSASGLQDELVNDWAGWAPSAMARRTPTTASGFTTWTSWGPSIST
jgi:hypothetical protein